MKAATHTPGPWKCGGDEMTVYTDHNFDFKPLVASTAVPDLNLAECKANARLIAAAPDLLAALDQIANGKFMGGATVLDLQHIARAAIAKARGEA